jgi:hypothetical protein
VHQPAVPVGRKEWCGVVRWVTRGEGDGGQVRCRTRDGRRV